jgi:hypothetical protein
MWSSQQSTCCDESITKKITAVIRQNLHKDCPLNIKQSFTAKSLSQGSIGELTLHSDITVFQACDRTVHSTNTSIDSYIDTTHLAKTIPDANVLAGKINIYAHIVLMKLNAIGILYVAQVDKLVDKLFSVNVPAFDKCGHLSVVLCTRAASLIMHHRQLTGKFPGNAISSHLYEAARGAIIVDPRFLDLRPTLCWMNGPSS